MECQAIRPLLYRFSENRLVADDAKAVADHLAGCPECRARLSRIVEIDELAEAAEYDEPSPRLRQALIADYGRVLARQQPSRNRSLRKMRPLRWAAAFAFVALGSGTATWLAVQDRSATQDAESQPPKLSLDHLFPLHFSTQYRVVYKDGREESGANIYIVQ